MASAFKYSKVNMEEPLCFSQSFVNKQNVRSFGNTIRHNLLKSEGNGDFLQNIFPDNLVSQISPILSSLLSTMKNNLKEKSKQDFGNYFPASKAPGSMTLLAIEKEIVASGCWTALCDIIPKELLSNNHNIKMLKKIMTIIVFSMKGEHMTITTFLEQWKYGNTPWSYYSPEIAKEILFHLLKWIIKYVLAAIICLNFYVNTCKLSHDEHKLYFFWKNQWQGFHDKQLSKLLYTTVLIRSESYCLDKNINKQSNSKYFRTNVPKLFLILKGHNEFRPIVRYKSNQLTMAEKKKIKDRLFYLQILKGKHQFKIEPTYNNLYQHWIKLGQPKLYFVKADLTNAFGSIDIEELVKILCQKHIMFQKAEKDLYLKKRVAQLYKDLISEIRNPLLVRAGSTIYEWKRGLVQGYKYSPALSELYYDYLDAQDFSKLLEKHERRIKLLTRVVDDYLFISDSLDDAQEFIKTLIKFRNVNYDKTVVNFDYPNIPKISKITFLGYCYNTENLQVSRANNVFAGQMCYKIAFTNAISNLHKFLENRICQSGIQINGHIFNFHYNDEELIWEHTFITLCLSANKFCTILAILCDKNEMSKYLILYKRRVTVKLCNSITETLLKNKPADVLFMFCINHFRYLSWKALLLCARQTPKCNGLIPLINVELAKSNCIFGKWKAHASRINQDGVCKDAAVRDVCTRTDLRLTMKSFETLPKYFQCYNNKSRYL